MRGKTFSTICVAIGTVAVFAVSHGVAEEALEEVPAKRLFGFMQRPALYAPESIGGYAKGCLAGAEAIPLTNKSWQAMRLSRERYWGHPRLVAYIKRLAGEAQAKDGWPGLLVGDMSQARGGPMLTGHKSHQIGLDADLWFTPMPSRTLTRMERENTSAISMLDSTGLAVNKRVWTKKHVKLLRRAASYPGVARIFVHPAIKKALCDATAEEAGRIRWMHKVRSWYGHHYHFHVRLGCTPSDTHCVNQKPVPMEDGCGATLDKWFKRLTAKPKKRKPGPRPKPRKRRFLTLDRLPPACRVVLASDRNDGVGGMVEAVAGTVPLPERRPLQGCKVAGNRTC